MSLTHKLPGRRALSEFRLHKLLQQARKPLPTLAGIASRYWHFIKLRRPLSEKEAAVLRALLTYGREDPGPVSKSETLKGDILLVVPRLGTISPWASKATDIARQCGLDAVERIERGTAYLL